MKKINNFLKLGILTIILSFPIGCSDSADIVQEGEININNSILNLSDMKSFLEGGIYGNLDARPEIAFTSIFTDECGPGYSSGGQFYDLHRFQLNSASDFIDEIWFNNYRIITSVNLFLQLSEKNVNLPSNVQYNDMIAQAKAIRAYAYFELISYYSTDPTNDNALGVMLYTHVPGKDEELPRVKNGDVYNLIDADLLFAYNNIQPQPSTTLKPYYFVSKNMINALRARMYLTKKDYVNAALYANNVISTSGIVLSNATAYTQVFNDAAQGEQIFTLARPNNTTSAGQNIGSIYNTNTSSYTGSPLFEVGRNLYNLLIAIPTDVKKNVIVDASSQIDIGYLTNPNYVQDDVIIVNKYPGQSGTPLRNNIKIFRLSEMYMILAECYANSGSINGTTASTAWAVKKIRDARCTSGTKPLPVYATSQDAWKDILLERRVEFCFEGHRYLDLKRIGSIAGVSYDRNITDDEIAGQPVTIPITDRSFTLPIPIDEINNNSLMQQNPNY